MKQWLTLFLLFLLSPGAILAAETISGIEVTGEIETTDQKRILQYLPFKAGDAFDPKVVQLGIQYLKDWGIFDSIEVQQGANRDGIFLTIRLHEAKIISEIGIKGNYPYIAAKIRKRLNLYVGEMLIPERVEEQKERIKKFYERQGFFNTVVHSKVTPAPAKNSVRLVYHIIKGERLRYGEVRFEGVKAFLPGRMRSFIKEMDLYSKKRLKDNLRDITDFYRSRGYLKAKVRVLHKEIDLENLRVSLVIQVTEGPKVEIIFGGKRPFRLSTLKKTITLYREGNFDTIELGLSREALLKRLKQNGYQEAQVSFKKTKIDADHYRIVFYIIPGPRSFVYSIDFTGNESIAPSKLKKQMFSKEHSLTQKGILDRFLLEEDRKVLAQYYGSRGFDNFLIGSPFIQLSPMRTRYDVTYDIIEGERVMVRRILFEGEEISQREKLLDRLENREGEPLNKVYLEIDAEQVRLFLADNGHPYSKVDQRFEKEGNQIDIIFDVERGPEVRIGEILFLGDVLTGVKPIREAIKIREGDLYSRQKILEAGLNLRRLGAFQTVSIDTIGLEERQTTIPLKIKVEERKPFVVELEAQYSTDTRYSGALKFTNYNSFGWAKQTRLILLAGIEKDRMELSWLDPRFLGGAIQMSLSSWLDYEKEPLDESLQGGGGFSFFRLFRRFGFLGGYQLTRNFIFRGEATIPDALRDSTLSEITLSASYDNRNSFSDPTSGVFGLVGSQFFNEIGGLNANFVKLKSSMVHYLPVMNRLIFSNTIRLDRFQSIGPNVALPKQELLTLGGDDTLRGFKEDRLGPIDRAGHPLGGRVRFIYNSELHIRLGTTLQGAFFYDLGSLTNTFPEIDFDSVRHSAGFGLRYITPVGPIRADYGIILDREPGENFGRFHLTFGYPL